jgi:hypothetical protein
LILETGGPQLGFSSACELPVLTIWGCEGGFLLGVSGDVKGPVLDYLFTFLFLFEIQNIGYIGYLRRQTADSDSQ